uniref:CX domain-containing protein n=1 Tax=Panagrellus redivivus TaxID=6233 RepID=A0A7E4VG62_PANRE
MSRWDSSPVRISQNSPAQGAGNDAPTMAGLPYREVYQHGTIGKFLTRVIEEPPSQFVRCIYQDKYHLDETVTLLCEKRGDCCTHGCCPKDQFWMVGVFVLLAFVLIVFLIGACSMICCYQRSKAKQRKEEKETFEYADGSQVGVPGAYPPGGYSSYSIHESAQY